MQFQHARSIDQNWSSDQVKSKWSFDQETENGVKKGWRPFTRQPVECPSWLFILFGGDA
jgi:hypothetical protein